MASNEIDWQVGLKSINKRANKILYSGQWSDCVFIVGNENKQQIIKAHKLILSMASPVFEAMFHGTMAEKGEEPIEILDVRPQAFKSLLKYIYTDEYDFTSFDQACEICYAAKKYMIPPLVQECTKFIWKDLHPGNVCRAYAFVRLFEEPQLLEQCMSMIKTRTEEAVQDPSFDETDISTLKAILTQDTLHISELSLWEGVLRWSEQECLRQSLEPNSLNQRKVLAEILPLIRFLTMTPNEFANGPALASILTQEESFGLLMNISSPGVASLPQNFSSSTISRKPPIKQELQQSCQSRHTRAFSMEVDLVDESEEQLLCNCAGPLCGTFNNDQLIDCPLSFNVDRDICILGVILPTQLRPLDSRSLEGIRERRGCHSDPQKSIHLVGYTNKYPELIYAFLQDADGCRLTYTHFTARVPWENTMEVLFNRPIYISPNITYKIVVILNRMGRYPLYSTFSHVLIDDVNFTFEETDISSSCCSSSSNGGTRKSIVKTLIFKRAPHQARSCRDSSDSFFSRNK